jgi:biotin carboxylase
LETASAAISSLEIEGAVVHTEIKLTPDGPRLIELNGRLAGRPPFVLRSISDVNLFQAACRIALGEHVHFDGLAECRGIGFWRMLQPPLSAQRVLALRGVADLQQHGSVDDVLVKRAAGQPVELSDGTDGAVVTVTGRVGDLDELAAVIQAIDESIEVDYEFAEPAVGEPASA